MKPEQLRNQILAADLLWIPGALAIEQAVCPRLHVLEPPLGSFNFVVYVVCTVLAWVLLSESMDLDGFRGGWRLPAVASRLVLAVGLLLVLLFAIEKTGGRYLGRVTLTVFAMLLLKGFLVIRWLTLQRVFRRHRSGNLRRVVILGSGRLAAELAAKFNAHPELLCQVVGFLWPGAEGHAASNALEVSCAPSTVSSLEVVNLLQQQNVDEVVMAHPPASREVLDLIALCREQAIRVSLVPHPYELYLSRPHLLELGGLPLLQLGELPAPATTRAGKRALDLVLGAALLTVALPLILVCAAFVRITTGRAFRWEPRVGWRGTEFSMLRLNIDRDLSPGSHFARLLWQLSISELPQLWNVLRGEMSLVGPRPEGPERAHLYSAWQQQRLAIKPGMTGLAQVHGLREQHSSEDKTRYDLQYMLEPSLLKDLALIIETTWTLTVRMAQLLSHTFPRRTATVAARQVPWSFTSSHSYPEILQHAHRTQPGSD